MGSFFALSWFKIIQLPHRILVGAPKATTNSNFKHDDATPGKVYACRFKGGCENIHVQEANYEVQITKTAIEKNDHAMLGSTLDVYGDVILVKNSFE